MGKSDGPKGGTILPPLPVGRVIKHSHHIIGLPGIPGPTLVTLLEEYEGGALVLWFPVSTASERIGLKTRWQRTRVQREYKGYCDLRRLPTPGGMQELVCVTYEALAHWLSSINPEDVEPAYRLSFASYRQKVFESAGQLLAGKQASGWVAELPADTRSPDYLALLLDTEQRVSRIERERAVFVGDVGEEGAGEVIHGSCPNCGHHIAVSIESQHRARIISE